MLPIGQRVTSLTGTSPAYSGGLDGTCVASVKEISAPCVGPDVLGFDAVDEHQKRGTIGVLVAVSEPDRLRGGVPVATRAVR